MSEVLSDGEVYRKLTMLAENPEYAEAMNYRLKVQVLKLGKDTGDTETYYVPLSDAEVVTLTVAEDSGSQGDDFARVLDVQWNNQTSKLRLEADHRGPEHGWDGWIGEGSTPREVIDDIELVGVDRDE